MVLPSGFEVPSLLHLGVLVVGAGLVGAGLDRTRPAVTGRAVLALSPWMLVGSSLYVCYQVGIVPAPVAPFASSPTVYLTAAVLAGATWVVADARLADPLPALAAAGGLALLVPVAAALLYAVDVGTLHLVWPTLGVAVSAVLAGLVWLAVRRTRPGSAAVVGGVGPLVVFGHALDGVSTAVGVDVLGFGEQTPLSRLVLELAAGLPTEPLLGVGWLFVLVKLALAAVVVHLFAGYVREAPTEGWLLLGVVAAVGLGPGAHNVLLYVVAQPGF